MSRYVLDNPAPGRELQKLLVRQSKDVDGLNKLERAFYLHLLQQGYPKIYVQSVTLKLADKCRYTCDFICIDELGNWLGYEVKGAHMWEDSWVKVKVVARMYPMIKFRMVRRGADGGWDYKDVPP